MAQYIDKDAVIAEIDRELESISNASTNFALGRKMELANILSFLNTLEVKEINEPDWCHHKVDLSDCSEEYRKAYYDGWNNCNQQHSQCNAEQKSADKVEPKFKEGQWVVTDKNNVVQIKSIRDNSYVLENTMRFTIDYVDKCWHLWTIQDAKAGDVLVCKGDIKENIKEKEVDLKKEFDNYAKDILACDVQFKPFTHLYNCAKYFYELGLKAQKRE